jgi:hypothetical protein
MAFDFKKIEHMVLMTEREQRQQQHTAPVGTIFYVYGGQERSICPGDSNYRFIKACYDDWKKAQADKVRRQRDQEALTKIFQHMEEVKQRNKRLSLALPGSPPALAHVDNLFVPLQSCYQAEAVEQEIIAYVTLEPYTLRYGCYTLFWRFEKVMPSGPMGRRQEERARLLRDRLVAFVKAQLLAARWRIVPDEPGERWRWEGEAIVEQEQQLAQLAFKTWRGRAMREGNEKIIALPDSSPLLQVVGTKEWHRIPEHENLEYVIDPDALLLRVRRRRTIPQKQEQQRVATKRLLDVIGDPAAHERGAPPAYQRTIETRPVTFLCRICRETVTQERLPGPMPLYCSDTCREEARRQQTLERVRRLREQRKKNKQSAETTIS